MELLANGDEHNQSGASNNNMSNNLASPSRCRSVPRRVRVRQATAATAAAINAALVWVCWALRVVRTALLRYYGVLTSAVLSRRRGDSVVEGDPSENQADKGEEEGGDDPGPLSVPSSPGVLESLESGLGGDDIWRETWRRHEQMLMLEQQQLQLQEGNNRWGEGEVGLLLPLPMVPPNPAREVEASPSPCGTQASNSSKDRKASSVCGATAPASPAECEHTGTITVLDAPSPAGGVDKLVVLTGGQGSCCGLCGYTLEEGQRVARSPSCSQELMVSFV